MSRAGKALSWVAINGLFAVGLYFAVLGVEWASNVVRFGVWVTLLLSLVTLAGAIAAVINADNGNEDSVDFLHKMKRSVPRWLGWVYDIAYLVVLAALGWFFTAFAWLLATIAQDIAFGTVAEGAQNYAPETATPHDSAVTTDGDTP